MRFFFPETQIALGRMAISISCVGVARHGVKKQKILPQIVFKPFPLCFGTQRPTFSCLSLTAGESHRIFSHFSERPPILLLRRACLQFDREKRSTYWSSFPPLKQSKELRTQKTPRQQETTIDQTCLGHCKGGTIGLGSTVVVSLS